MKTLNVYEIARAVGSKATTDGKVTSICTDSRKIKPGCLFIALRGDNFDGHEFAVSAVAQGAAAVLCERETGCGEKEILVEDTRKALLRLAAYYRSLFNIPVIAITGSVGKTTTKEMTHAVLSRNFKTLKNEGNLNNEIGLPMTIFNLDESYEAAVLEMGMSNFGEISRLSMTAKPTIAILTNIGVSHMEQLGSQENILQAKLEILDGMDEEAPLIINGDDPLIYNAKIPNHPLFCYGIDNKFCRFKAYTIEQHNNETTFMLDCGCSETKIQLPTIGRHNIYNALAAFSAGFLLGVTPQDAAEALYEYVPSGMRQRIKTVNGIIFIEDCYNASPDSQRAALTALAGVKAERRIAVLGDMLELGTISGSAHSEAGDFAAAAGVDILLTYGERSKNTAKSAVENGIRTVLTFDDKQELAGYLGSILKQGDAVLFKASRGMRLEDVITTVYEEMKVND